MYMIVGLGNPGKKYEKTRHNLGFLTLDCLADDLGSVMTKEKFHALTAEARIGKEKVLLVKPQTYMNRSGDSVREILRFYRETPDHLIVVYDDFDLPMGNLRIRKFGSAGTHNGMRSVVSEIGSDRFPRIRIGTGREAKDRDLIGFVIGNFSKDEKEMMAGMVRTAADAAQMIVTDGVDYAMNRFNTRKKKEENE